jgi:hypothetical protein
VNDDRSVVGDVTDAHLSVIEFGDDQFDVASRLHVVGRHLGDVVVPVANAGF